MANGRATITFDGINLDNCIKQGMELTGQAKCPYCKQVFSFQMHLQTEEKLSKYEDTLINGDTVTTLVPDTYEVSIKFSERHEDCQGAGLSTNLELSNGKEPCVPCSRCTPNCERLA